MEFPKRKPNRLRTYDYSNPGAYFITICTQDKRKILWQPAVGEAISLQPRLSNCGRIVDEAICAIGQHYQNICVDKYVIMPNHVHLIIRIMTDDDGRMISSDDGRMISSPTVSTVVGQMKRWASKQIGQPIWQRSFHDHVIRNEHDFLKIWQYIDENPQKWEQDCFYCE